MKKLTLLAILSVLFVTSSLLQAQVIDPKTEAEKQGTKRANNKIEEGVDAGFDKLEEGIGSLFGKKKKKKKSKTTTETSPEDSYSSNNSNSVSGQDADALLSQHGIYPPDGATDVSIPVTFKWKPIDHDGFVATGHEFYLNEASQHENRMVGGPRQNQFTYNELKPNTTYSWKAVGSSSSGYMPGPGGTFTTGGIVNEPAVPKMDVQWSKYDFVPGDEVIFSDGPDIMEENGEFPSRWDLVKGQVEIANIDGENVMMFISGSPMIIPYLENASEDYLPEVFTVEYDMYTPKGGNRFQLYLTDRKNQRGVDGQEFDITPIRVDSPDGITVNHSSRDRSYYENGCWTHVALAYTKGKLKVYLDESRLINIPRYEFNPTGITIQAYFADLQDNKPFYLKNVRIAKGGVKYYDRVLSDGKIICNGIRFDVNKSSLKRESMGPINKIFQLMQKMPELNFSVEGHTDSDGDDAENQSLSEQRAQVVMNKLIAMGIASNRLKNKGHGESQPVGTNATPEGKANNRRVEFIVF